jgi:cytochrome c-type biogenesis protein CcmH
MKRVFWLALLVLTLVALSALPGLAQTPTPNEINAVAKELWCPLCNGVRLDNCELQACIQMREVIGQKLAVGEDKAEIKAYFVQQYGDVVLGEPARQGFNLVVWIFPILAVVVGLGWLAYLVMTWRKRQPAETAPVAGSEVGEDEYLRRVEQQLRQDD